MLRAPSTRKVETYMEGRYFIDTGVFIASFDDSDADRQNIAQKLIGTALAEHVGIISYQVIEEMLHHFMDRFEKKLEPGDTDEYLERVLIPLCEVYPTVELYETALNLCYERRYSYKDALILAASQRGSCKVLFSDRLKHGGTVGALTIHNPFRKLDG